MRFIEIIKDKRTYYGGNQRWFTSKRNREMGCGIIAAANVIFSMELRGSTSSKLEYEEYMNLAEILARKYIFVLPKLGINGIFLAMGINMYFMINHIPYIARWGTPSTRMFEEMRKMLDENIPVILAIGPNNPWFFGKKKLPLYIKNHDTYMCETHTSAHYVCVTEIDDDFMTISSWGSKYYIHKNEFMMYIKKYSNCLFSNVMLIRRKNNA